MFRKLLSSFHQTNSAARPTTAQKPTAQPQIDQTQILAIRLLDPAQLAALEDTPILTPDIIAPYFNHPRRLTEVNQKVPYTSGGLLYQAYTFEQIPNGDNSVFFFHQLTPDDKACTPGFIGIGAGVPAVMVIYRVTCCSDTSLNALIINPENEDNKIRSIPSLEGQIKRMSALDGGTVETGKALEQAVLFLAEDGDLDHEFQHVTNTQHACQGLPRFPTAYRAEPS